MNNIPTSVTVIGWLLVIGSAFNIPMFWSQMHDPRAYHNFIPELLPIQITWAFTSLIISIAVGFMLLLGAGWARWVYVVLSIFGILFLFPMHSPMIGIVSSITPLLIQGIIIFFLFRPKANEYFSQST